MGDIAFPAFSLAPKSSKAPQMIAADYSENKNSQVSLKVVSQGPYVNFFSDKYLPSVLKLRTVTTENKHTMLTNIGNNEKMLLSTCLVRISLNHFLLATCVHVIGEIACHLFQKIAVIKRSRSTIWETGVNFGMLIVAYKKNGATKKL